MPNVTISVPDELKKEMDQFSEVNWSGICRKAIKSYVNMRKHPTPNIQLEMSSSKLTADQFNTGHPTLTIDLRIYNRMDSTITIDRILGTITFWKESQRFTVGRGYDLNKRIIGANSVSGAVIHFPLLKEKIEELQNKFDKSFDLKIRCKVYVDGFEQDYYREVKDTIPIDIWKNVVKESLKLPRKKGGKGLVVL